MTSGLIWLWLGIIIALSVLELSTTGLVCVWFAIGAVAGLFSAVKGLSVFYQLGIFALVTAISLLVTKPLVKKLTANRNFTPTNADRVLGQSAQVVETINNRSATGTVYIDGKTWTARSIDGAVIPPDSKVRIVCIEGVKLMVEAVVEESVLC